MSLEMTSFFEEVHDVLPRGFYSTDNLWHCTDGIIFECPEVTVERDSHRMRIIRSRFLQEFVIVDIISRSPS